MVIMSRYGNESNTPTAEFFCDSAADLEKIEKRYVNLGSVALVVNGGSDFEIYLGTSDNEWKKV